MNREDIIRMAHEAGGSRDDPSDLLTLDILERFAELVASTEREECAKLCDLEFAACWHADALSQAKEAKRCADAIRARSYHFRGVTKMMDGEQ